MSGRPAHVLVYVLSALVLSGVIVVTAELGLGVRTTYGSGIGNTLAAKIERDFLADQAAEAQALSAGDAAPLSGRLADAALIDVGQQISDQSGKGPAPTITFQPSSLNILRAQDANDPSLLLKVEEDGTKTVTTSGGSDSVPSQQTIQFHGDFWLRADANGRYLIADQSIQNQPASALPSLLLVGAALLWISLAALLVHRQRRPLPAPALPTASDTVAMASAVEEFDAPIFNEPPEAPAGPPARVVIRTFGGLQVHQDGQDWAPALAGRSTTAFVWLVLLIAAVRQPGSRQTRKELGQQVNPGVDRESQLKTMRNFVYALRELPAALNERILAEPQVMGFSLEDCEVDALELVTTSAACVGRRRLSPTLSAKARRAIDGSAGVFLPEFESIEAIVTGGRPTCTQLIAEVREWLTAKRTELTLVLADSYLASHRTGEAIALLESANQSEPDRRDVRTHLAAAYRRGGRTQDAAALELEQSPGEVSASRS